MSTTPHPPGEPLPDLHLSADDLLSISRGLRAPLNTMLECAQRLNDADQPLEGETLEAIRRNGARQVRLLDNLAALADLQMDMVPRVRERVLLGPLFSRVRTGVAPELAESEVELLMPGFTTSLTVMGEADRLWHALRELVRNAITASRAGGRIGVLVAARPSTIAVEVADSGRGIPAAELADILHPFGRTSFDTRHRTPGTGLGLTVADGIVRAHGGTLEVNSAPGRGTRVKVQLSRASSRQSDSPPLPPTIRAPKKF
jgi:signal transduction histidine kinase